MSADPIRVLYVPGEASPDRTAAALESADDRIEVAVETEPKAGLERLAGDAVDCIVAADSLGRDPVGFIGAVRERSGAPVVLVADDGSEALADRATAAGATEYFRKVEGWRERLAGRVADVAEVDAASPRLEEQKERIEALHWVAREMKTATDRQAIYDIVIDAAEEVLEFDICIIDEIHDRTLIPKAVGSGMSLEDYYQETPLDAEDNLGAETCRKRETMVIGDLHAAGYAPANFEYESAISVPLEDWGLFQAATEKRAAFDESDRQLVELLIEHAVAALNRQQREAELQERAAELERQNERLDQFASIVSHDLRNPLSVAKGRLELAREECDSEHLEHVAGSHERMRTLIEELLTLARADEPVENTRRVSLGETLEGCWSNVDTADATLAVDSDGRLPANPSRFRQLLENLVRNAVEHGGEDVTVRVGVLESAEGFYVGDDGPGVPPAERDRVFESGYSTVEGGTGFGLDIVAQIAEAHGWDVAVTDGRDGGARFEFTGIDIDPA